MKRFALSLAVVLCLTWVCSAQNSTDDTPATQADVERYLQAINSHDMMKKLMSSMTQGMHQMWHEQFLKHKEELPPDFEAKMTATMDDMLENAPMDEIMQAMVPAYQKHLTKGDIDNLVAFYSSPTGAKLLREMPAMMGEAMQDMMPILTKYMETVQVRLKKQTDDMIAQAKKQADAPAAVKN
jgi:hypothetical protein